MTEVIARFGGYLGVASLFLGCAFLASLVTTLNAVRMRGRGRFLLPTAVIGICWLILLHLHIASHR
jgi:hypothetical protein